MNNIIRWLALVLSISSSIILLCPGLALALPPGAPKIGMVCTPGSISGTTHTFNLIANTGTVPTPDGDTVFIWSYANADTPDNGLFQYPGPALCVNQGETVVINLTNTLPEATSIIFPGQQGVTASGGGAGMLTTEAATGGGTVQYTFTAGNPGTYLYESGSDISKQLEMGLYGALIVRPTLGSNYAYNDTSTQFDPAREYLLLLSELDPDLHHAVETGGIYDFNALHNHYFTINGRENPDTILDNGTDLLPNQPYGALVRLQPTTSITPPALIRMINVGELNHPFHPHGNHTRQIAQDGRLLLNGTSSASTEHFGETIGSGQTQDFLLRWDTQSTDTAGMVFNDNWNPNTNPLPVPQPNYRNLTFKDGNTWYSGNPYLGYKGTLPTGVVSHNICGEWYFPLHSHALNEFTNFDEGFGGMGTLLRVDPSGGCFTSSSTTTLTGGVVKSGSVSDLSLSDTNYYQVNPVTTTKSGTMTASTTTLTVASATGFPIAATANPSSYFFIRIQNEVLQVTNTAGTSWTVVRGQLGTSAASHNSTQIVSALATDWYNSFSGFPAGALNLKVTYQGKNCSNTSGSGCTAIIAPVPQQTVKICNWTISGVTGCSTSTSAGWVALPPPPAQPQSVGSTDVSSTWTLPNPASAYIGTGAYNGQVRVLIHTQRWTASSPTPFSTWGNFMRLVYDAP